jgi:hypothetical protein
MFRVMRELRPARPALLIAAAVLFAICPAQGRAAEEVTSEAVEKAAEKAVEKATQKAVEAEAARAELTGKRPTEWYGPTKVEFFIFLVDIDSIDDAQQNFTANVYLRLRWKDSRLADPNARPHQLSLDSVWNPRVILANQQGLVPKSLPEVVVVSPDGTVDYYQRYTGKLSQPLRLYDFPMDKHPFTVQFVAAGYTAEELAFEEGVMQREGVTFKGGSMSEQLSLPDWKVLSYSTSTAPYRPVAGVNAAGFSFTFKAKRYVIYYLWQVVLPLGVIVIMSWAPFWVDPKNVGARVGVATSAILTLIAYRFVIASLLPRLPYMTRMDYFTVGSTLLVLLVLLVILCTSFLDEHGRERATHIIDRWARLVFPLLFISLSYWFLSALWKGTPPVS